jgi:hypothetical protein
MNVNKAASHSCGHLGRLIRDIWAQDSTIVLRDGGMNVNKAASHSCGHLGRLTRETGDGRQHRGGAFLYGMSGGVKTAAGLVSRPYSKDLAGMDVQLPMLSLKPLILDPRASRISFRTDTATALRRSLSSTFMCIQVARRWSVWWRPRGVGIARNQGIKAMQSQLPMHRSPRCGARTRSGRPCRSPAMPNGRCRMHGGYHVEGDRLDQPDYLKTLHFNKEFVVDRDTGRMMGAWSSAREALTQVLHNGSDGHQFTAIYISSGPYVIVRLLIIDEWTPKPTQSFIFMDSIEVYTGTCEHLD